MSQYLHLFDTVSAFTEAYNGEAYEEPWVSLTTANGEVNYNKDYTYVYFTLEILTDGELTWYGGYNGESISYSKNGGTWETLTFNEGVSVSSGDKIQYKGENTELGYCTINSTAQFNAKGNIMSLLYGDDFSDKDELEGGEFTFLFNNCQTIISAKDLKMPSKKVGQYSFGYNDYEGGGAAFRNCTNLVDAPELPATELGEACYAWMFQNCTSLRKAPNLPATTLAETCYENMFAGCTSLTGAPSVLPALFVPSFAYDGMFNGCTSLVTAPEIQATGLGSYACYYMFSYCESLTTSPDFHPTVVAENSCRAMFMDCTSMTTGPTVLPATELHDQSYWEMFMGCTSLVVAPTILATTLGTSCCVAMFEGCTSLTTVQSALPATTLVRSCYSNMFSGCTSLTTAPILPATTLANGCYGNMFRGCQNLNFIKAMFTTTPEHDYTYTWVEGVAASGTFVKNSSAQWNVTGTEGVPSGWTVQTASA